MEYASTLGRPRNPEAPLDQFVGPLRRLENYLHFFAKGTLHDFANPTFENQLHRAHQAQFVSNTCLHREGSTKAKKRPPEKIRHDCNVVGGAGELVSVKRRATALGGNFWLSVGVIRSCRCA
jgi:hypothetical protein